MCWMNGFYHGDWKYPTRKLFLCCFLTRIEKSISKYHLGKIYLPPRKEYKYLGVIFDTRLTWKPHLDNIVQRCKKGINILKCIAYSKFCNNVQELLHVHRAIIRSLMDYACEAYDSALTSVKNILNSIQ